MSSFLDSFLFLAQTTGQEGVVLGWGVVATIIGGIFATMGVLIRSTTVTSEQLRSLGDKIDRLENTRDEDHKAVHALEIKVAGIRKDLDTLDEKVKVVVR